MGSPSFIGLDLAWKINGNHSGIAVLAGDHRSVHLEALSKDAISQAAVLRFIAEHASTDAVLAVDAPLAVFNWTGQRACETEIARSFWQYGAGCHTTNLSRPYARAGMDLVTALEPHGFVHDFDIAEVNRRPGRWIFEVYPHPAMVRLFDLAQIIRYKKGRLPGKRIGLRILQGRFGELEGLEDNVMLSELLSIDLESVGGRRLKQYEDTMDAVFCAYLAWHCWRWGAERNEVYGTLATGYIVVPKWSVRSSNNISNA